MNTHQAQADKGDILIVDDTPDNLRLLSTMLQSQGYRVRKAINGQLALKGAQIAPPDLILLDINMPIMNGYEVCEQLKIRPETGNIPVIFISALDQVRDKIKAFQIGGVDYITKPFHVEEVLARVENQLKQQRLFKQLQEQNTRLTAEITVRQRAEEEIFFLVSTTQAIAEASDFHSALSIILRSCCQTINWDFGEAWVPRADGTSLEPSQSWYASSPDLEEIRQHSSTSSMLPLVGLAGRVWSSKQPEWVKDISVEPEDIFTRSNLAVAVGLKASFGVPILLNNQVLAILVFLKKTASPIQPHLVDLVNAVASQLGSLIQRKQTEEALRIAEEKYHSIVENAVEGIFQTSPDGRFLSANLALAKIYGYNSAKDLIESIEDVSQQVYVDSNRRQEFLALMEADNEVKEFESLVYRKDSQLIWVSENTRAVRDSQGRLLYYEGTVSDITERKLIQQALKFQQEKTETLLLNILPAPIAMQLQQNQSPIADHFEEVSVLFADIVGFTEFSNRKTPEEMVSVLNVIFSRFDQLAQQYGLEKIKTIGDAYMVVGGLPTPRSDHAQAIAQMALSIQAVMADINTKIGEAFTIRIGINSGPVVAGVIGLSKFIYDLWGDTVNIASRMEVTGVPGKTQVTSATYEQLKEEFLFEDRGQISIKGKGEMKTYFLISQK